MPVDRRPDGSGNPNFIVEVEGFDGEDGRIVVENDRADGSRAFGDPDKIYCIAAMGDDGVVRFNDWGYATAAEALDALAARNRASARQAK